MSFLELKKNFDIAYESIESISIKDLRENYEEVVKMVSNLRNLMVDISKLSSKNPDLNFLLKGNEESLKKMSAEVEILDLIKKEPGKHYKKELGFIYPYEKVVKAIDTLLARGLIEERLLLGSTGAKVFFPIERIEVKGK